jgi:crossover junction endodeoxyribonuclease RuvC
MRVLGVDPGLATAGYAVIECKPGNLTYFTILEAGVITTPAGEALPTRLHTLHRELRTLIDELEPDVLAIETLIFSQNRTTAIDVAQARGVILLAAHELPVKVYTPLQVKHRITGYGRANKLQMQRMMQQRLRLKELPKPDDAADALAIAWCYILEAGLNGARAKAMAR